MTDIKALIDALEDLRDVQRRVAEMAWHGYMSKRRPTPAGPTPDLLPMRGYLHPASRTPRPAHRGTGDNSHPHYHT